MNKANEWITDRLPTEADGDVAGNVRMVLRPGGYGVYYLAHWSYVGSGAPWQHTDFWQRPAEPAPAERNRIPTRQAVQILSFPLGRIAALCNDGTIWVSDKEDGWHRLARIPQEIES